MRGVLLAPAFVACFVVGFLAGAYLTESTIEHGGVEVTVLSRIA